MRCDVVTVNMFFYVRKVIVIGRQHPIRLCVSQFIYWLEFVSWIPPAKNKKDHHSHSKPHNMKQIVFDRFQKKQLKNNTINSVHHIDSGLMRNSLFLRTAS